MDGTLNIFSITKRVMLKFASTRHQRDIEGKRDSWVCTMFYFCFNFAMAISSARICRHSVVLCSRCLYSQSMLSFSASQAWSGPSNCILMILLTRTSRTSGYAPAAPSQHTLCNPIPAVTYLCPSWLRYCAFQPMHTKWHWFSQQH